MDPDTSLRAWPRAWRAPHETLVLVAVAGYVSLALARLSDGGPLLVIGAGVLPWVVVLARRVRWSYGHHGWLALLHVLAVLQAAVLVEHAVTGQTMADPGSHVVMTATLVVGLAVLTVPYGENLWLRAAVAVLALDLAEHAVTALPAFGGSSGDAGLLGDGGVLAGPVPLPLDQLHGVLVVVGSLLTFTGLWSVLGAERARWAASAAAETGHPVQAGASERGAHDGMTGRVTTEDVPQEPSV